MVFDPRVSFKAPKARKPASPLKVLATPDGRYIVVRGRLWRAANPTLGPMERERIVEALMDARRAVGRALRATDPTALALARAEVGKAKVSLGERGPVWWTDGAPDMNRRLAKNTVYSEWFKETREPE